MNIYLTGYQPQYIFKAKHTNWWPWNYLKNTFKDLGYNAFHLNANKIDYSKPGIFICWNAPDSLQLLESYKIHKDSIIIQKLTGFDSGVVSNEELLQDPDIFFTKWHWPQYQKLHTLQKEWPNFYAFGAQIDVNAFPEKQKIIQQYKNKIFWIPWGSMTVSHQDILNAKPIIDGFKYDVGFVGSKWGTNIRGNINEWEEYLKPILNRANSSYIAGKGTPKGMVSVKQHIDALKKSRICPIIHATSWKKEKGIMDRFWTVFSLGRFGVTDNTGILDFYNENEVVLAYSPEEYVDKSIYYMQNVDKQIQYIEKIQARIKTEYNQHNVWKKILGEIFKSNNLTK